MAHKNKPTIQEILNSLDNYPIKEPLKSNVINATQNLWNLLNKTCDKTDLDWAEDESIIMRGSKNKLEVEIEIFYNDPEDEELNEIVLTYYDSNDLKYAMSGDENHIAKQIKELLKNPLT